MAPGVLKSWRSRIHTETVGISSTGGQTEELEDSHGIGERSHYSSKPAGVSLSDGPLNLVTLEARLSKRCWCIDVQYCNRLPCFGVPYRHTEDAVHRPSVPVLPVCRLLARLSILSRDSSSDTDLPSYERTTTVALCRLVDPPRGRCFILFPAVVFTNVTVDTASCTVRNLEILFVRVIKPTALVRQLPFTLREHHVDADVVCWVVLLFVIANHQFEMTSQKLIVLEFFDVLSLSVDGQVLSQSGDYCRPDESQELL